jgi:UDP-N-acetyl-D-glucosamine dehydrogenase
VDDPRHSPAERVIELLLERGAAVSYHDPYVGAFRVGADVFHRAAEVLSSVPLTAEALAAADVVVILTAHRALDYGQVVAAARLVVDAANATGTLAAPHVVRLGAPPPEREMAYNAPPP